MKKISAKSTQGRRRTSVMRALVFAAFFLPGERVAAQARNLPYFLEQAQSNSPSLRELQGQLLAARIDSLLLHAARRTQVAFQSNDSYAPIIRGIGYDEAITNIANVSALVQATRNFTARGSVQAQLQSIALQRQALLDTIRLSQQDLIRTLTEQYINAYSDQVAADFAREVFELMRREEAALKKLTEKGVYKQVDYLNFYVTMQQQELASLQAGIQYNADYLTLNYLAGISDTSLSRIDEPRLSDTLPDFYGSVFYTRFATDSLRLANERALLRYQYKPRIGAYSDAGYQSSLQNTPWRNFGFSFGLSLMIPLY
ncbi:MAG: hypothetical protein EOP50_12660, partial [Sphingobacteriales bacterium]